MKMINVILAAAIAITALFVCPMKAAEKKSYIFGMRFGQGTEFDSQNKTIFTDVAIAFSKTHNSNVSYMWFKSDEELIAAAEKGELDFVYTSAYDYAYKLLKGRDYIPLSAPYFSKFSNNSSFSSCIYTNKLSDISEINGLKNKRLSIVLNYYSYIFIRNMTGIKPELYFSSIAGSKSDMSSIYSLALNTTDSILIADISYDFMRINNPGPTKKIKNLRCSDKIPNIPIFSSKKVPPALRNQMISFLENIYKEEQLKIYWPLFNMYGFKYAKVNINEYDQIINIYDEANKKGWDKDYEHWIKYAKEAGE
jgi:ABC-type phosphate/phosphonate transport system substrate-binding protein